MIAQEHFDSMHFFVIREYVRFIKEKPATHPSIRTYRQRGRYHHRHRESSSDQSCVYVGRALLIVPTTSWVYKCYQQHLSIMLRGSER